MIHGAMQTPIDVFKQTLVDRLDSTLPQAEGVATLPDELAIMVLEHLLLEDQQPVMAIQKKYRDEDGSDAFSTVDPCATSLGAVLQDCRLTKHLAAVARETYFKTNTIRIDAPEDRWPRHILQSALFTSSWAKDIRQMELNMTIFSEPATPIWYTGNELDFIRSNRFLVEPRDAARIVTLLEGLQGRFRKLARLTLMSTVRSGIDPSWPDDNIGGCGGFRRSTFWARRQGTDGLMCCLLEAEKSNVLKVFRGQVFPTLEKMDLEFAALKWRVDCGHERCGRWIDNAAKVTGGYHRLTRDGDFKVVVVKERKMASSS